MAPDFVSDLYALVALVLPCMAALYGFTASRRQRSLHERISVESYIRPYDDTEGAESHA